MACPTSTIAILGPCATCTLSVLYGWFMSKICILYNHYLKQTKHPQFQCLKTISSDNLITNLAFDEVSELISRAKFFQVSDKTVIFSLVVRFFFSLCNLITIYILHKGKDFESILFTICMYDPFIHGPLLSCILSTLCVFNEKIMWSLINQLSLSQIILLNQNDFLFF